MIALAVCIVLVLVPLHSAFAETQSPSAAGIVVAAVVSTDLSGTSSDPDGLVGQHGVHCGCGVIALECSAAPVLPAIQAALRFTGGPRGAFVAAPPPTPPPPRA